MSLLHFLLAFVFVLGQNDLARSIVLNFETLGGIPDDSSFEAATHNGALFNETINTTMQPGDTLLIPNKTFTLPGGLRSHGMKDVVWQIDGTLSFLNDRATWPVTEDGTVEDCIYLENMENVTFTSSGKGTIDGNGRRWWGAINDILIHNGNTPKMFTTFRAKNVTIENLLMKDSPTWNFWLRESNGIVVRYVDIDARFTKIDRHTLQDLQAFYTDGIDVTGQNVHIHDCNIWVQDDCIAVKGDSKNMLFEKINCSGLGLVIGSLGDSEVTNITFRDSVCPHTFKGIYMKTRWSDAAPIGKAASISNILYQNITIIEPEQWAIWMGPAQQTGQPCSLLWPLTPRAECRMSGYMTWTNITLRDIYIISPKSSPGILFGNVTNPMTGIVFDNVVVTNPGSKPFGSDFFYCVGVEGIATGNTNPAPPCFNVV